MSLDEVSRSIKMHTILLIWCIQWIWLHLFWQRFNKAAEDIKTLTSRPTDDELKEIYALFKQATVGDINVG